MKIIHITMLLLLVVVSNGECINNKKLKAKVAAVYVFGDSGTDVGNNNYLNTPAKVNYFPYGIDFNNHSTGRFTNGKNSIDFITDKLGLPMAPPFLSLNESARRQITTGINYASGGCGIFYSTGPGGCLPLRKQVEFFASTVKEDLPHAIQSTEQLRVHLAKSICFLIIGSNDKFYKLSPKWNATEDKQVFLKDLFQHLVTEIQTLYDLGARKFVVHNVYGPKFHFPKRLKQLQSNLPNSTFTQFYDEEFMIRVMKNASKYGFKYIKEPCFIPGVKPVCNNRKEYIFFDEKYHMTESAIKLATDDCFSGTMTCNPYNIAALARV